MSSAPPPPQDQGLPPVEPPSARLMVRLFLVPGLIVAGLVVLFLAGPMLYGGIRKALGFSSDDVSADEFLRRLDSDNHDIRYRAASDLAQVLLRKDELAADPVFALELATRLDEALKKSEPAEAILAGKFEGLTPGDRAREVKALEADRTLITYLTAALGNSMVPAGSPLLRKMAGQASGMEAAALAERRRRALFALATLGNNVERFDALDREKKDAVIDRLLEAERKSGHATRARDTRLFLESRMKDKPDSMGVIDTLVNCAGDDDPFIREAAALASNFWPGTAAEEGRIEEVLVALSRDDGRGQDVIDRRRDEDTSQAKTWPVVTRRGYAVQANATIALARRGSPKVRLDVLEELLQPEVLGGIYVIKAKDGKEMPDNSPIVAALYGATRAVPILAKKRTEIDLAPFKAHLKALVASGNKEAAADAARALAALGR